MDIFRDLIYGLSIAGTPTNLLYCLAGVSIGTLVGLLPGLGPVAGMVLFFPVTFHFPAVAAIIMLAGIYYGCMYGGSITSILVNIPGEASSVVTCLDGYAMAQDGRAGPALGISAMGSFIGGTLVLVLLTVTAAPLARMALAFSFPEYFSLMCCGLVVLTFMARGSMLKAMMMAALGIFLGTVGTDIIVAEEKFTFGIRILADGLGIVPVIMGLFGISEVFLNIEEGISAREIFKTKLAHLYPSRKDWALSIGPIMRASGLGFFYGILPGGGPVIAGFTSYAVEKKLSREPQNFGKGMIEGVAGPETANNAAIGAAFIPLLILGIPCLPGMAFLLGALLSHGVQVGPLLLAHHRDVFWGVVASMYIGNVMLLILNLPLVGIWVKLLKIPYTYLFPCILLFCVIGAYSINNSWHEIILMNIFGILGYLMKKFNYETFPMIMAMVLSPLVENSLRQSLLLSHGSFTIFFTRPISAVLMVIAIFLLIVPNIPWVKNRGWKGVKASESHH